MIQHGQPSKKNRWVVKVGSSLLTNNGKGLDRDIITQWAGQIAAIKQQGIEIVLVSSGAVSEGMTRLQWDNRPNALHELQAAAAIGQMGLIEAYETAFQKHQLHTAQILLTHADLANRTRYLNARSTLRTLLKLNVIPVVNENDTVASEEIAFGDNDTLAGMVANLIDADRLILLTDQNGMYDADPRQNKNAKLIEEAHAGDPRLEKMAASGKPGTLGRGGMLTKVQAAEVAARSGTSTIIASGREKTILQTILSGIKVGTLILPPSTHLAARKQWLANQLQPQGRITLDDGAAKVLKESGRSLLAVGVTAVEGHFRRGELVTCIDQHLQVVAKGLINYNADETRKIMGKPSREIENTLGYLDESELIHRDNLVLETTPHHNVS